MKTCNICGGHIKVLNSRRIDFEGEPAIYRRRECQGCAQRFSTFEVDIGYLRGLVEKKWLLDSLIKQIKLRDNGRP